MSCVVHDVKFLESPFPHGSRRDRMQFCCLPHWRDSFRVYKVIVGIKVVLINKNVTTSIENSYNGNLRSIW